MSGILPAPLPDASATNRGAVNTGTQTFAGAKTFSSSIVASITGNAATVTNGIYTTGSYADPAWITSLAGSKVSGDISGNAGTVTNGVYTNGDQTVGGIKTFTDAIKVTGAPVVGGLTSGTQALLGSYNSSIGAAALWLVAAPSTSNFTLSTATTAGGTYALQGTVLNANAGSIYLSSAGVQMASFTANGTGASDVAVKLGTSVADASVHTSAKLLQVSTGIGGTPVEALSVKKGINAGFVMGGGGTTGFFAIDNTTGVQLNWNNLSAVVLDTNLATIGGPSAKIRGLQVDGASAVAVIAESFTSWSNATAKLLSIRNSGVEKDFFLANGQLNINQPGINTPGIILPSGAGGYGYGGSIQWGAGAGNGNNIGYTGATTGGGSGLYVQSLGANVPVNIMSFNDYVAVTGWSTGSPGATDVLTKIGTRVADASVDASAKLASFSTGIGGTPVESIFVKKGGVIGGGTSNTLTMNDTDGAKLASLGSYIQTTAFNFRLNGTSLDINTATTDVNVQAVTKSISIHSDKGAGPTDVAVKIGSDTADGSVDVAAKLASFQTGIGGTPVESIFVKKGGVIGGGTSTVTIADLNITLDDNNGCSFQMANGTDLYIVSPSLNIGGISGSTWISSENETLSMYSRLGAGATDVSVKVGSFTADASVSSSAKLLSINTGLGGTPVEKSYIDKSGNLSTAVNLTTAQTVAGGKACSVTTLTSSGASIAIDLAANNNFSHTLTENTTLAAPSNPVAGQSGAIAFTQHASSPKTLAYNAFWKFVGGTVPTLTATNSAVDVFTYYVVSGSFAVCSLLKGIA